MSEPAFESEELDLNEAEKAAAINLAHQAGQPSVEELLRSIERHGQDQAVLEAALGLPLEQYRVVEDAYKRAAPAQKKWRKS